MAQAVFYLLAGPNGVSKSTLARYPRTLLHLARAVRQADLAMLYDIGGDSGDVDKVNTPVRVAVCRGEQTQRLAKRLPKWAKQVLG